MRTVAYFVEAESELYDALVYYRTAGGPGLATAFLRAVDTKLADVAAGLLSYAAVPGRRVRQCPVTGFPYSLVYSESPVEVRVVAVAHHRRRPGYWKARLRRP